MQIPLTPDEVVRVMFSHLHFPKPVEAFVPGHAVRARTVCTVVSEARQVRTHGVTYCSALDQFAKETGRKVALTRALQQTPFTKDERRRIWEGYLSRPRGRKAA